MECIDCVRIDSSMCTLQTTLYPLLALNLINFPINHTQQLVSVKLSKIKRQYSTCTSIFTQSILFVFLLEMKEHSYPFTIRCREACYGQADGSVMMKVERWTIRQQRTTMCYAFGVVLFCIKAKPQKCVQGAWQRANRHLLTNWLGHLIRQQLQLIWTCASADYRSNLVVFGSYYRSNNNT